MVKLAEINPGPNFSRPAGFGTKARLHGLVADGLRQGQAVWTFRRKTRDRSRRYEAHVQICPELHAWICAYGRTRRQAIRRLLAELVAVK